MYLKNNLVEARFSHSLYGNTVNENLSGRRLHYGLTNLPERKKNKNYYKITLQFFTL